ncbi:GNAT family N-acetyltransferase [Paenibacillus sp. N1-5-1-14]|uniref:GNAT family N-acetyltransferase n=1 Tax=Paenibacillus radicibacter TaxID=2972488 RepID=UPI0021597762|nr:GNAT family N-acetyltransferase [Paenibacillus radicibacter]MCR8645530.1 GNAT family N-acetyltransferase [Paenibacillus radicibacter]
MIDLIEENLEEHGCFCLRSQPNSTGYIQKKKWLLKRLGEGLKYIKLMESGKQAGFIEYTPIEHSSRVVYGENYLVIHCLWVSMTGKGYASELIKKCIEDAKRQNKDGVIVITNPDTSWTPSKDIFIKNDFIEIDQAPYGFELLVHKFNHAPSPFFPNDWDERLKQFHDLTLLRTQQCPFVDVATENMLAGASQLGIDATIIDLTHREQLLRLSPTPYGIYGVVYKNKLVTYHRLTVHSAKKRLKQLI